MATRYSIRGGQPSQHSLPGKVIDVTTSGTGGVLSSQPERLMGFTFDKLAGYRGESPKEYGVSVGTSVRFEEQNGQIRKIWVLK